MGMTVHRRQVTAPKPNAAERHCRENSDVWGACLSRRSRRNLAGAVILRQLFYKKAPIAGGVLFLSFAGHFDAVASLEAGGISNQTERLLVAFILDGKATRTGGDALRD